MITPAWRNLHVYPLDAPTRISIRIAPYDEGIGISSRDIPAEGTINVLVSVLRVNQGSKEKWSWHRRWTELAGDSVRRVVYHPHFGVSFGVDTAAFKVQATSDMHVFRSPTQNTHIPIVYGSRIVDTHTV
jgi:hypothetical protein